MSEQPVSHKPRFRFHWRLGRDVTLVILVAFSAVGAVVGASTGIASLRLVNQISSDQEKLLTGTPAQAAEAADNNPANPHLTLISLDREQFVDVVIGADGDEGYILRGNIGGAGSGQVFQLWAQSPAGAVSLGSVGETVAPRYFTLPRGATTLFISEEAETGAIQPTTGSVVSADLPLGRNAS